MNGSGAGRREKAGVEFIPENGGGAGGGAAGEAQKAGKIKHQADDGPTVSTCSKSLIDGCVPNTQPSLFWELSPQR
jgi:hypothetical protein